MTVLSVFLLGGLFWVALALWIFMLRPIRSDLYQIRVYMQHLAELVGSYAEIPASVRDLAHDLHSLSARQDTMFGDVIHRLEKAAERAFYTANQVADELVDREERVDTNLANREEEVDAATDEVASDLADSVQRATDTVIAGGEAGAAADAALTGRPAGPKDEPGEDSG